MKKAKRIKPQPLQNVAEFLETIVGLTTLETLKRKIEAERDAALIAVNQTFDARLDPVLAEIKGRMALAEQFASANRGELLPKDRKSASYALARFGWREGNRKVEFKSGWSVDKVIAELKANGLGDYVREKEEIAKDKLLADCKDDKTITVAVGLKHESIVAIADAGLKITQGNDFYVEPVSDAAETLKPEAAA